MPRSPVRFRRAFGVACLALMVLAGGSALAQDAVQEADEAMGIDPPAAAAPDASDLDSLLDAADKDVSQLSNVRVGTAPALEMEVSTVSRQESTVGKSPAAVFVITNEMIRRSGARSVPEALRMAPGVEVARIDSNVWAISIRGFNQQFANKLLVQIDGRVAYTPTFGGVYWDVQDVLLEDVERIEVIRGPGAAVWGANAVNGVINILTKTSGKTQGLFAEGGGGTEEKNFANARYGGKLSNDATYRVYGKWFERGEGFSDTFPAADDWRMGRGGFRVDWQPSCCDTVTLQGDAYRGDVGARMRAPTLTPQSSVYPFYFRVGDENSSVAGWNTVVRWTRELSDTSNWTLQAFFDRTERDRDFLMLREDRDTVDVDFQHQFQLIDRHTIIWGGGYRNTRDQFRNPPNNFPVAFIPDSRADDLFSYFVEDQIELREELLFLTAGTKFQHNDYTGFEMQPTVRLLLTPTERQSIWCAVSRAVRTPTRSDDDVLVSVGPAALVPFPPPAGPLAPLFPQIVGNNETRSEEVIAYEFGMRAQTTDRFSWDLALFFNDYRSLQDTLPGEVLVDPTIPAYFARQQLSNAGNGYGYGFEPVANWQVNDRWKLTGVYSFLRLDLDNATGEGESARNRLWLQSSHDMGSDWQLDLIWRYVDELPGLNVPAYGVMDIRLAWEPTRATEIYVVGRNLLDRAHPEFASGEYDGTFATEVEREVYGGIALRY